MSLSVAIISGSLRKESYNTKLARAFATASPEGVVARVIDISALPMLSEDLEQNLPRAVQDFQAEIKNADAVIFVTPEYNRSFSAPIKNAIDWGSRPDGLNVWEGKPVALAGCTLYNLGTFGAQTQLRQVLMYLDMHPLQQPEFYMEHAGVKFDDDGKLTDQKTRQKIDELWSCFIPFAHKIIG